jgi:hypothetical protein
MEDLTYIQQGLEELVAEIQAHPLVTDDYRRSYLELTLSVFNSFYIQRNTIQAARIIQHKPFPVTPEEKKILDIFVGSIYDDGYFLRNNGSYRSLITDCWSMFEFCLTYTCDFLFEQDIKIGLLEHKLKEIISIISKYEVSDSDMRKVTKKLLADHLTHVPMVKKYTKLHLIYEGNYRGDWAEDSLFLEFFGKYRNCMHTNYIYHGNNKAYTFLGITYEFIDGEPIRHSEEPSINNTFDLALKLKNTCRRLFDAIDYPGLIPFPSDKVKQP